MDNALLPMRPIAHSQAELVMIWKCELKARVRLALEPGGSAPLTELASSLGVDPRALRLAILGDPEYTLRLGRRARTDCPRSLRHAPFVHRSAQGIFVKDCVPCPAR